jgi:hypothetical protein
MRRLPRTTSAPPAASVLAVTPPDAAPDEQDQAVILAPGEPVRRVEITVTGSSLPRIVRVGSSSVKGAPFGRVAKAMGASAHP